jgi:hypothetical protein
MSIAKTIWRLRSLVVPVQINDSLKENHWFERSAHDSLKTVYRPLQQKFGDSILISKIGDSATSMPDGWN